ncbi:hypothetical protein [Beijerinckia mobilis]|uniref:hypothetical protein n=1 Tax=Beijerinckia mobilis TaxID=231434 RepID=UPI00055842B4|nr:hypothetical protein [Beijerinckia mobilis]
MLDQDSAFSEIQAAIAEFDEQFGPRPTSPARLARLRCNAERSIRTATKKRAQAFIRHPHLLETLHKNLSGANARQLIAAATDLAQNITHNGNIFPGGDTKAINAKALMLYGRWMRFVESRLTTMSLEDYSARQP